MVGMALTDEFDVAILGTGDTDLQPAVETVLDAGKRIEVIGWARGQTRRRLTIPGRNLWVNWIDQDAYASIHDPTDYTAAR